MPRPRLLAMGVALVLPLAGCGSDLLFGGDRVDGSGQIETRRFDVGEFDEVAISNSFEAEVTVSPDSPATVEVTADDNFFEHIDIDVAGARLRARTSDDVNLRSDNRVLVTIVTPTLSTVDASGATDVLVRAAEVDTIDFVASGASELDVVDLDASDVAVEVSGASRVSMAGAGAETATAEVSGASSIDLRQLSVGSAIVEVSGASVAELGPAEIVSGSASGASRMRVDADTVIDVESSGASSVERR